MEKLFRRLNSKVRIKKLLPKVVSSNGAKSAKSTAWHYYAKSELPQRIELPLAVIEKTDGIKFTLLETYFYTAAEHNVEDNDGLRCLKILAIDP